MYWRPVSKNLAAVYAITQPNILVQITVAGKHKVVANGLLRALEILRDAQHARLYFVVPDDKFPNFQKQAIKGIKKHPEEVRERLKSVKQYALKIGLWPGACHETRGGSFQLAAWAPIQMYCDCLMEVCSGCTCSSSGPIAKHRPHLHWKLAYWCSDAVMLCEELCWARFCQPVISWCLNKYAMIQDSETFLWMYPSGVQWATDEREGRTDRLSQERESLRVWSWQAPVAVSRQVRSLWYYCNWSARPYETHA